jgi:ferredoxin-type protein NapF
MMDSGRRAFLRGALLTRSGRQAESIRQQPLGPPPPWHRGWSLQDACQGCTHPCVSACEEGIIRLHPADHALSGTPYLDFGDAGCTFCQACVTACPLQIEITAADRPRIGTAFLNQEVCIAWNDVICMACQGHCDYQAISTEYQRRARVDTDRCTGCGMCVSICPVGALSIGQLSLPRAGHEAAGAECSNEGR